MVTKLFGAVPLGISAIVTEIEVDVGNGLPHFNIVGMGDTAVMEARDRVRSAIKNSGFEFPNRRITINLAPASTPKEGASLDLPMALGILLATGQLDPVSVGGDESLFFGELSLDGSVKLTRGNFPAARCCLRRGLKRFVANAEGAAAALPLQRLACLPTGNLAEWRKAPLIPLNSVESPLSSTPGSPAPDPLSRIRGQPRGKRALEIAAAGGHNVLFWGPPGSGKTMLSRALPSLFPPMDLEERLEVTEIHAARGLIRPDGGLMDTRPFRAPHHTISEVALIGGGKSLRPGEVTLAHNGILFLDELPEFPRRVLEALRQPLSDGKVHLARASGSFEFPAEFLFIAAMNPCPCGHLGDRGKECRCSPHQLARYRGKISGPILDRFDIILKIPRLTNLHLTPDPGEPHGIYHRERVAVAHHRQRERFPGRPRRFLNGRLAPGEIHEILPLTSHLTELLEQAVEFYRLSIRATEKILRCARTIMDLDGVSEPTPEVLREAIQLRSFEPGTSPGV